MLCEVMGLHPVVRPRHNSCVHMFSILCGIWGCEPALFKGNSSKKRDFNGPLTMFNLAPLLSACSAGLSVTQLFC
jgi:uncharacterized ferredoxin-like protein